MCETGMGQQDNMTATWWWGTEHDLKSL